MAILDHHMRNFFSKCHSVPTRNASPGTLLHSLHQAITPFHSLIYSSAVSTTRNANLIFLLQIPLDEGEKLLCFVCRKALQQRVREHSTILKHHFDLQEKMKINTKVSVVTLCDTCILMQKLLQQMCMN
jgi:hypothetical protein